MMFNFLNYFSGSIRFHWQKQNSTLEFSLKVKSVPFQFAKSGKNKRRQDTKNCSVIASLFHVYVHDEEQDKLMQSLPSVFFTGYYKILCSMPSDEAVPEEGAGISGLYLEEGAWMKSRVGWCRAYMLQHITKFFVLCI